MASKLAAVISTLTKEFWQNSVALYKDMEKVDVKRISSGVPSLDYILGGWIPVGRIIEIYGPNASGKTTLTIQAMIQFQRSFPDKRVAFIDTEHALDPNYATALWLNMNEIVFSQPDTAEQALSIIDALAESWEISLIVLDSVAKLAPKKEVEWNIWDAEMGMRARLMGQGLRKIVPNASKAECTVIFINQVRDAIGNMYGPSEVRPSSKALEYDASLIIRTSSKQLDDKTAVTKFQIKKNKVGMPFRETEVDIAFGKGYDIVKDLILLSKEIGAVERNGAYFSFWEHRWQGSEAMVEAIKADPELYKEIEKKTQEKLKEFDKK